MAHAASVVPGHAFTPNWLTDSCRGLYRQLPAVCDSRRLREIDDQQNVRVAHLEWNTSSRTMPTKASFGTQLASFIWA